MSKRKIFINALTAVAVMSFGSIRAETVITDTTLTADATWTAANSPYIINSNFTISATGPVTLTIEPGVEVRVANGVSIEVGGRLRARGTANTGELISFVPQIADGAWNSIRFVSANSDATITGGNYVDDGNGSILEYVEVKSAGGAVGANIHGAIVLEGSHPYLNHVHVYQNNSSGVYATNITKDVKIENSLIELNLDGDNGGGIFLTGVANMGQGKVYISNNVIQDNSTTGSGGGLEVTELDSAEITGNTISGNSAKIRGGGIDVFKMQNGGKIENNVVNHNSVDDGVSGGDGGGIALEFADMTIQSNHIFSNSAASQGGGVYVGKNGNLNMTPLQRNFITGNQSVSYGGGVHFEGGRYQVEQNVIAGNQSVNAHGGAIDSHEGTTGNPSQLQVNRNILADNITGDHSSAINIEGIIPNMNNNAILRNNNAESVVWVQSANVNLDHNTFAYNAVVEAPGGSPGAIIKSSNSSTSFNQSNFFGNYVGNFAYWIISLSTMSADDNWWGEGYTSATEVQNTGFFSNTPVNTIQTQPNVDVPLSPPLSISAVKNGDVVDVSWEQNPEGDVAGYHVYWGAGQALERVQGTGDVEDVVGVTTISFTIPADRIDLTVDNYIAVTAYDTDYATVNSGTNSSLYKYVKEAQVMGNESWFSEEIMIAGTGGSSSGSSGGGGGGAVDPLFLVLGLLAVFNTRALAIGRRRKSGFCAY